MIVVDLSLGLMRLEVGCCILVWLDALTFGLCVCVEFALYGATCVVGLPVGDLALDCLLYMLLFVAVALVLVVDIV